MRVLKKIVVSVLLVVFFAFTIFLTVLLLNYNKFGVTQFEDTTILIIKNSFSSEKYPKDSVVIVESKPVKNYKVNEEVFTYHLDGKGGVDIQLGVVSQVHADDNAITFANGETYSDEFIIGTGEKVYLDLGTYLGILESKWGFLIIILVPNFFIFIHQLYTLIVEIKYGKEEEYA